MEVLEKDLETAYEIVSKIAMVGVDIGCELTNLLGVSKLFAGISQMHDEHEIEQAEQAFFSSFESIAADYESKKESVRQAAVAFKSAVEQFYNFVREMSLPDVPEPSCVGVCIHCVDTDKPAEEISSDISEAEKQFNEQLAKEEGDWL